MILYNHLIPTERILRNIYILFTKIKKKLLFKLASA